MIIFVYILSLINDNKRPSDNQVLSTVYVYWNFQLKHTMFHAFDNRQESQSLQTTITVQH